jgi:dienelactone hydrolase
MRSKTFIEGIIRNPIIQTIVIFISGGWIILEITEYFIENFGLNENARNILLIALLSILPIALFLAWYLTRKEKGALSSVSEHKERRKSSSLKSQKVLLPGILTIIAIGITVGFRMSRQSNIRWAKEQAIPQIKQLYSKWVNLTEAYEIALIAQKYIPKDPVLIDLLSQITTHVSIQTDPPGADIYLQEYNDIDSEWQFLGRSPIDSLPMPGNTLYRWKIEKEGYDTVVAIEITNIGTLDRMLDKKGTLPAGMVRVTGQNTNAGTIPDFYIDKYEVTNKQFKEFLDTGGYQKQEYWKPEFIKDGRILIWEEAMNEFRDKTGQPGPAAWQAGDYPDGKDDFPVTGISWYEAVAYAEFMGKSLPSSHHWHIASGVGVEYYVHFLYAHIIPLSNFFNNGPIPIGTYQGTNRFGTYDMVGNVREWCWNESREVRCIRGGAWSDVVYMSTSISQQSPFDRSPKNGFRCVRYIDMDKIPEKIFQPLEYTGYRDYYNEESVPDDIFKVYKNQFLYDKTDLGVEVYETDETNDDWTIEKIRFNAAYGNERVIAYLYLPKETVPPYQTIIYFPGSNATSEITIKNNRNIYWDLDFILKNGRAVMYPVYKGTYERQDDITQEELWPNQNHRHTEYQIKLIKDFSRSIDYLETRQDIDSDKLAYFGLSWGGRLGAIIPAVEERLKVSILNSGGLPDNKALPEADFINYISRVKIPVLMLNGRYDYIFPFETSIEPMFDLLGTPENDKVLKLYDTDHNIPKNELIKETLNWLDKYLGPVNR